MLKNVINFYASKLGTHKKKIVLLILLQLLINFSYDALPFYSQLFIDKIVITKDYPQILIFSILVLVTMTIVEISQYFFNRLHANFKMTLALVFDLDVTKNILDSDFKCLGKDPASYTASKIKADINSLERTFDYSITSVVANFATIVWVLGYSLSVNYWIFFAIIIIFFPSSYFYGKYYNKHKDRLMNLRDTSSEIETFRYETIAGSRILKLFNAQNYRLNRYKNKYGQFIKDGTVVATIQNNPSIIEEIIMEFIPLLLMFVLGGYFLITSKLTVGEWVALNMYSGLFIRPINNLSRLRGSLVLTNETIERLEVYLNLPKENKGKANQVLKSINSIQFSNVNFSYSENKNILKNINFRIEKPSVVAIMGESGSGKSTLANIISGLYNPDSGEYFINSQNHTKYDTSSIRKKITLVSISDFIFSDTIKENIKISSYSSSEEEIIDASKKSYLSGFIDTLENKYDEILGEKGFGISDGQKQRLLLTRSFLKKGDVVIFDEMTSSLDSKTEAKILNNILEIFSEQLVIFITHHPSVTKVAQNIILLREGKIADIGKHNDLIKNNEYYQKMYKRGVINES